MSEIQAACLYAQLEDWEVIQNDRLSSWNHYFNKLKKLEKLKMIELPTIPNDCNHNGHMFFIKTVQKRERNHLLNFLNSEGIGAVFHYIPLHSAPGGISASRFNGEDKFTTTASESILRLPLWFGISKLQLEKVIGSIYNYFKIDRDL